jgi:hypothetical protein
MAASGKSKTTEIFQKLIAFLITFIALVTSLPIGAERKTCRPIIQESCKKSTWSGETAVTRALNRTWRVIFGANGMNPNVVVNKPACALFTE